MARKIYLCGHTGSVNRGCHALLLSTAHILKSIGIDEICAMTFAKAQDEEFGLHKFMELVPYAKKSFFERAYGYCRRKIINDGVWGSRIVHKDLFRRIEKEDILFNVGGDTYCYGKPYISLALNEMAHDRNLPTVFWGCSVDARALDDVQIQKDITRYKWIVARESLSYELLNSHILDKEHLLLACDPAFHLPIKEVPLPKNFAVGNTLGINLSPLVFTNPEDVNDLMYQNVFALIDYIIEKTDMQVCLIPHVYETQGDKNDLWILNKVYQRYKDTNRVAIVRDCLDSTQIKYIISNCRFFIGARTHSMIAAYSTGIPGLAISYSIKSLGIAKDLFGDHIKYTVNWKDLKEKDQLLEQFVGSILNQEEELCKRYSLILPEYKETIIQASKTVLGIKE